MVKLHNQPMFLVNGNQLVEDTPAGRKQIESMVKNADFENASKATITYSILQNHNTSGDMERLQLKFDSMASHDITFVGIVQTSKVSGLEAFPMPYVLTNCHNSLGAVGGCINEDDHMFGLSAAKKYGGIYVPPHLAVIHSYMREAMAGCGRMILGSDSHTRYGALGTMGVGEGGGELVKQLLKQTYDIDYPRVVSVYLDGKPAPGVGPQDVALAIIGAVFKDGFVKNSVLEFVGDGIASLSAEYRNGIDVMTTETTCWTSIWQTDETVEGYLSMHNRVADYQPLHPGEVARYDGAVYVDMSTVKPMIALPFHPSNTYEIDTLNENLSDILHSVEQDAITIFENPNIKFNLQDKIHNGKLVVDQGVIAGCAGGIYDNIMAATNILKGGNPGNGPFSLSVYPGSQPVMLELARNGAAASLIEAGVIVRTAFCGPCFGAGDVPANNAFSIRHTTRNFPNREGSKPNEGQISGVALMDARSIAATAINGGVLTSATSLPGISEDIPPYQYDDAPYQKRVYYGVGHPQPEAELQYGPNIVDWPAIPALANNLLVKVVSYITDPVTTTDEIIPSGETSSFRSNPIGLAQFTLSRKDPAYLGRAKEVHRAEIARQQYLAAPEDVDKVTPETALPELAAVMEQLRTLPGMEQLDYNELALGSAIFAIKPGDGSAREQAASCQRVLGGSANFANEYATKRYRSNLINWGMLPFLVEGQPPFQNGDYVFIPAARAMVMGDTSKVTAYVVNGEGVKATTFSIAPLTQKEKEIVRDGCLINYNRNLMAGK